MHRRTITYVLLAAVLVGCRSETPGGGTAADPPGSGVPGRTGVEGTVRDATGAPVPGAAVARLPVDEAPGSETVVTAVVAVTDPEGRWAWDLPAGTWQITATAPGLRDAGAEVVVREGERARLDLVLRPA